MKPIAVTSWVEVGRLSEEQRAKLAFSEAALLFPDGKQYRRETGARLDMHFVVDLGGDERDVHDLFVNVADPVDLYCLQCGALDGRQLEEEYHKRSNP